MRPPIELLDAALRRAGLQPVPAWYIRAMQDPSITLIDGRPKEEHLPFSPRSREYAIQQQWLAGGMTPPPAAAARAQAVPRRPQAAPARRRDGIQVPVESPGIGLPSYGVGMDTLLSPEDAAADPLLDDPDTGSRFDAGIMAHVYPHANAPLPDDADTGLQQDAGIMAHVYPYGARPAVAGPTPRPSLSASDLDAADAAAVDIPADPTLLPPATKPATSRTVSVSFDGPPAPVSQPAQPPAAAAPRRPIAAQRVTDRSWIDRRAAELVARGSGPEAARATAEVEFDALGLGMPSHQANRAGIAAGQKRAEEVYQERRANPPVSDGQRAWDARVAEADRQRAHMDRLTRAGVAPEQDMTAPSVEDDRQWNEWRTSGPAARTARYAPGEFDRQWNEAADKRRKENAEERAKRNDQTVDDPEDIDPTTGEPRTRGQKYRDQRKAADDERRSLIRVPVRHRQIARELNQMGIDDRQFGDVDSDSFDYRGAVNARNRALRSGNFGGNPTQNAPGNDPRGGRYGAVSRQAMMRQRPMDAMGRPDLSDEQRQTLAYIMSGGQGATANDIAALNAKGVLQGIEAGARANMRIQGGEAAVAAAEEKNRLDNLAQAEQGANAFVSQRGYGGMMGGNELTERDYNDLIKYLMGRYRISEPEARGIASKWAVKPGRAGATAPPAGR